MLSTIREILSFLLNLFRALPDDKKQEVIDLAVNGFERAFEMFYDYMKRAGVAGT